MDPERVRISRGKQIGLIAVGVAEIVFGVGSIGVAIGAIVHTIYHYQSCYYINYPYSCDFYAWIYRFSVSSQGIWTGCFVIISASLNIRLATNPTKQMGSISAGFSIFSFVLTNLMVVLEALAVSDGYYYYNGGDYNSYEIWAFHCSLLSFAFVLFALTLASMITSYTIIGCSGYCCNETRTSLPVAFHNPNTHFTRYPGATVAIQKPVKTQQEYVEHHITNQPNNQVLQSPLPVANQPHFQVIAGAPMQYGLNQSSTSTTHMYGQPRLYPGQQLYNQRQSQAPNALLPGLSQTSAMQTGVSNSGYSNCTPISQEMAMTTG